MIEIRLGKDVYLFSRVEIGNIDAILDGIDSETLTEEEVYYLLEAYRLFYQFQNHYKKPSVLEFRNKNKKF